MRDRVRRRQKLEARGDGTVRIAGVKDAHFFNIDHVPVWYESVRNYSWGKKDSGRQNVRLTERKRIGSLHSFPLQRMGRS